MTPGLDRATELERLRSGSPSDLLPTGLSLFEIDVTARGAASAVLDRFVDVLTRVLRESPNAWPSDEEWEARLPEWFVRASASAGGRKEDDERWSVGAFVYWFLPRQREWWWWAAEVFDADKLRVYLAVREPSFPHEALDWLFRSAGAEDVVDENLRDLMRREGRS